MFWENLREEEFENAIKTSKGLCVVPLGCLEKHGQHLPVGTDYIISRDIIIDAVKQEEAVIFPLGHWLGDVSGFHSKKNPETNRARGFIGINIKTLLRTLEEICDEIARNGFTKILFLSAHGGNIEVMNTFIREQTRKEKSYKVYYSTVANNSQLQPEVFVNRMIEERENFPYITDEDIEVMKGWIPAGYQGGHANFLETADIFAYHPELVNPDKYEAECGLNNHRTDYLTSNGIMIKGDWSARYPNCYSGAPPHGCSQSIGQAMLKIHVERIVRILKYIKEA